MEHCGKKLLSNIADLFKVKTILSLSVVFTTCILTFKGLISTESFMAIAGSVVTYYFTKNKSDDSSGVTPKQ